MGQKSLLYTYVMWLLFGWLGLHHLYLGRDVHAFIWWSTFRGMFGLGWFRDLWRIPEYVNDANEEASYIERLTQQVKRGTPQFNVSRFTGQMLVGCFYGILVRNAIPEHYPTWIFGLVVSFGVAVGVFLVGNVGRETGEFQGPFYVCYAMTFSMDNLIKSELGIILIALFGAIGFQQCRKFRVERRPKRGVCKRFFMISLGVCLVTGLWVSFFFHNAYVVTEDGESIKLRYAVNRFFNSPLWNEGQKQGWENMYNDFFKGLDPTGEQNALKVLNLPKNAGQEEIKKRYKQLAREWHPDKYRGDKETAQKRFMEIQEAYEILSTIKTERASKNQKKRNDYNV